MLIETHLSVRVGYEYAGGQLSVQAEYIRPTRYQRVEKGIGLVQPSAAWAVVREFC